jgi:peptidylprolyl isomerase
MNAPKASRTAVLALLLALSLPAGCGNAQKPATTPSTTSPTTSGSAGPTGSASTSAPSAGVAAVPYSSAPEEPMVTDAHGAQSIPAPPDVAYAPDDAGTSPSGLRSKPLRAGRGGKRPRANQRVRFHYTGWTTDGAMFDSSVVRGQPIEGRPDSMIPGMMEGLLTMTPGEQRRLWIPIGLAYGGKTGRPFGNLTFDVELIAVLPD